MTAGEKFKKDTENFIYKINSLQSSDMKDINKSYFKDVIRTNITTLNMVSKELGDYGALIKRKPTENSYWATMFRADTREPGVWTYHESLRLSSYSGELFKFIVSLGTLTTIPETSTIRSFSIPTLLGIYVKVAKFLTDFFLYEYKIVADISSDDGKLYFEYNASTFEGRLQEMKEEITIIHKSELQKIKEEFSDNLDEQKIKISKLNEEVIGIKADFKNMVLEFNQGEINQALTKSKAIMNWLSKNKSQIFLNTLPVLSLGMELLK